MKVDKLNQLLLLNERIVKSPNFGERIEVVNTSFSDLNLQFQLTKRISYKPLVKILGIEYDPKESRESYWYLKVYEDGGHIRNCIIIYDSHEDEISVWARNEKTALNASDIIMDLYKNPPKKIKQNITTKPKVDID